MIPAHPLRRVLDVLAVVAFVGALAASRIDEFVRDDAARGPEVEGRASAPRPARPTTLSELNDYSSRFETYYFDTFGLRDVLLRWNSTFDYFVLGLAPSEDLVVGRDGWIFYAGQWTLENQRGVRPLSLDALENWRRALESRRDALAAAGCAYLYVAAPNKETVYPERVPSVYAALGPTRFDQIADHLARTSTVEFLDLRSAILPEKGGDSGEDTLYPAHGTHWMGRASFAAYRAITLALARHFPGLHRYEIGECHYLFDMTTQDSWAPKMYLGKRLLHRVAYPVPIAGSRHVQLNPKRDDGRLLDTDVIGDTNGPRAIVYCDSFYEAVQGLLSDSFSEVVYVRGKALSEQQIADFRPDVFIDLFVERRFILPPPLHLSALPPPRGDAWDFDEARTGLFALDRESASGGLVATGDARASAVGVGAERSVSLSTPSRNDDVRLPIVVVPEANRVLLRVTASSATSDVLDVYWKPKDAPVFKIAWRVPIPLGPAVRSRTVDIDLPSGAVEIMLRTRGTRSAAILREFELRAVPR